ncbi:SRPBCC domain-containing protein [Streptomyces sp. NPDC003038]|uniref:SRPBCC domain-containing protein n=1 Tax=unclassified Streptomyces TaxID=2593676 RepID=UPI0033A092E7
MSPVSHGTSESRGDGRWRLHFEPHLPYAYEALWPALTTPDGLRRWLAEAEVLERRLGGAVRLRLPDSGTVVTGHVTAWDIERIVEYTVTEYGRMRFHLEAVGTDSTVIRFVNERTFDESGGAQAQLLEHLAAWHEHFELLESAMGGRPAHWAAWTDTHRAELRASYASLSRA